MEPNIPRTQALINCITDKCMEVIVMWLMCSGSTKVRIVSLLAIVDRFESRLPGHMAHVWMLAVTLIHNRYVNHLIGRLEYLRMNIQYLGVGDELAALRSKLTGTTDLQFNRFDPKFRMAIGDMLDTVEHKNGVQTPLRDGLACTCPRKCDNLCTDQSRIIEALLNSRSAMPWTFHISHYAHAHYEQGIITGYTWKVLYAAANQPVKDYMVLCYDTASNGFEMKGCANQYSIKLAEWEERGDRLGHIFNKNSNSSAIIIKLWLYLYAQPRQGMVTPSEAVSSVPHLKQVIETLSNWYRLDYSGKLEVPGICWNRRLNLKLLQMQGSLANIILSLKKGLVPRDGRLTPIPCLPNEIITMVLGYLPITQLVGFGVQRLKW